MTTFTYDAASNRLTLTDPDSNATTWTYDNLNRPIAETNQLSQSRTFSYDANGNLTKRIDRLGREIDYVYDTLNRQTAEKWYDGATLVRTIGYTLDAAGQLTQATDVAATYGYNYDGDGRVTYESQSFAGFSPLLEYTRAFDAASRMTTLSATIAGTADFQNTYSYDNLARLTSLNQQQVTGGNAVAAKRADFSYDPRSLVTKLTRYADATGTEFVANSFYAYDDIGRLNQLTHSTDATAPTSGWGTSPLAGYQYTLDAASRITSLNSYADGVTNYTLDNTNQLLTADHTGQTDESYSYDASGNRTMSGYSTGTNNRLSSDGTYNYTYDDEGNRLTRTNIATGDKEEYTWDWRNRLTGITFKDSGGTVLKTVALAYDYLNQWVRRSVDSDGPGSNPAVDTFFSHEGGQIALQFNGSAASNLAHRYLWAPAVDQLLADETVTSLSSAGTVQYPLGDQLGTLRDLASHTSSTHVTSIDNHRRYDDYGNLVSETNTAVDQLFGFTGRALDDSTGLQNNHNRWYDATTGRWMSEDPMGFAAHDTNLQRYVGNSPTNNVDPGGLITVTNQLSRPQVHTVGRLLVTMILDADIKSNPAKAPYNLFFPEVAKPDWVGTYVKVVDLDKGKAAGKVGTRVWASAKMYLVDELSANPGGTFDKLATTGKTKGKWYADRPNYQPTHLSDYYDFPGVTAPQNLQAAQDHGDMTLHQKFGYAVAVLCDDGSKVSPKALDELYFTLDMTITKNSATVRVELEAPKGKIKDWSSLP